MKKEPVPYQPTPLAQLTVLDLVVLNTLPRLEGVTDPMDYCMALRTRGWLLDLDTFTTTLEQLRERGLVLPTAYALTIQGRAQANRARDILENLWKE